MPRYSAARAWAMAMSFFALGMGRVELMYSVDVRLPDSMSMYAVATTSTPYSFSSGAARTCCPMSSSGLRPLTIDRNRIASALATTCPASPGKLMMGICRSLFSRWNRASFLDAESMRLVPTRIPSAPASAHWIARLCSSSTESLSGSSRAR